MPIATRRLLLRETKPSDVPALYACLGDADAMQYPHCFPSLHDCRQHVLAYEDHRRTSGYAPWTIIRKTEGDIIGWGGLYVDVLEPGWGVEIGYWFAPSAWG